MASPVAAEKTAGTGNRVARTENCDEQAHGKEDKDVPVSRRMEGNGGEVKRDGVAGGGGKDQGPGLVSGEDADKEQGSKGEAEGGLRRERVEHGSKR
eukprot:scaffold265129_cov17-Tisochrysis_lutea.AAC.1